MSQQVTCLDMYVTLFYLLWQTCLSRLSAVTNLIFFTWGLEKKYVYNIIILMMTISSYHYHVQYFFNWIWFDLIWFYFIWIDLICFDMIWYDLIWIIKSIQIDSNQIIPKQIKSIQINSNQIKSNQIKKILNMIMVTKNSHYQY